MKSHKEINEFLLVQKVNKRKGGDFSHKVCEVTKKPPAVITNELSKKYKNVWYLKKESNRSVAMREVAAQEFFRLLIPSQPKTRLVTNSVENETYVLSKQVAAFKSFQSISKSKIKNNIKQNIYKGLGDILILVLLMNEIDLKPANIGIDNENNIIKIDGDWCFARLREGDGFENKNYTISERELNSLPFLTDYYAYNWLDVIHVGIRKLFHKSIDREISTLPHFRNEINRTLLSVLILPDELIKSFFNHYLPEDEAHKIYTEISQRKNNLKNSALRNNSFVAYLRSEKAKRLINPYVNYLKNFKTTKKNRLAIDNLEEKVSAQFKMLIISASQTHIVDNDKHALKSHSLFTKKPIRDRLKRIKQSMLKPINKCIHSTI